jgi:hypothetical protein
MMQKKGKNKKKYSHTTFLIRVRVFRQQRPAAATVATELSLTLQILGRKDANFAFEVDQILEHPCSNSCSPKNCEELRRRNSLNTTINNGVLSRSLRPLSLPSAAFLADLIMIKGTLNSCCS